MALAAGGGQFLGIQIETAQGVLVPRLETEILAKATIQFALEVGSGEPHVIDMCTGAGNIACAVAYHVPSAHVWASDLTDATVALARRNADRLGLAARLRVLQGDLFAALAGLGLEGKIDLITCNPPYISRARLDKDRAHLLQHEPREAFDAGPYGLSIHQRVVREALPFLKPGGRLLFEVGHGQERQVQQLLERTKAYENFSHRTDAEGVPRMVTATRIV